jgi:hypothetical protein
VKSWLPSKRLPVSTVNAKKLVGKVMAIIQTDPTCRRHH